MLALLLLTSWFEGVVSAPSPAGAAAHVLLREESVVVEPSGRQTTTTRGVIRILTPAGVRYARAGVAYDGVNGQLSDFRAWVQGPNGQPQEVDASDFTDRQLSQGELRSPLRQRQVEATVAPGSLFLYQATVVSQPAFPQVEFEFQENELPVHRSLFRLTAPPNWTVRAVEFAASATRRENTWEMRDLAARPAVFPRLAITLLPDTAALPRFTTWASVAEWMSDRAEPAAQLAPLVVAEAHKLTFGLTTVQQRIRAVGAFVQGLRYVAIPSDRGQAGGFVPATAETVLSRGYGDCKDKATLLRALLRVIGINSWLVAINATDRSRVRPEWPSPRVFNHAILAIETETGLLYFDPSDPYTTLGELPSAQQGSRALLLRPGGTLESTPKRPGEIERKITLRLEHDGRVTGKLLETSRGSAAAHKRALHATGRYDDVLRSSLDTVFTELKIQDEYPQDGIHLYVQFEQKSQMASAAGVFLWKPLLPWGELPGLVSVHEFVEIEIHPRWVVEEMPEPVRAGSFSAAWFLRDGKFFIERHLRPEPGEAIAVERLPIVLRELQ